MRVIPQRCAHFFLEETGSRSPSRIGVASYPAHEEDIDSLVDKAEGANKRAKDQGKDRLVVAGQCHFDDQWEEIRSLPYIRFLPSVEMANRFEMMGPARGEICTSM